MKYAFFFQSIVDYTRCPDVTFSAAIDPVFSTTAIIDPEVTPASILIFGQPQLILMAIIPILQQYTLLLVKHRAK